MNPLVLAVALAIPLAPAFSPGTACASGVGTESLERVPAFPPPVPQGRGAGAPRGRRREAIDSLAMADIVSCAGPGGFRIRAAHLGFLQNTLTGTSASAEPSGLRVTSTDGERLLVPWDDVREVWILQTRERTGWERFERGERIGALAGFVIGLAVIRDRGSFDFVGLPFAWLATALAGGIVGGVVGSFVPGTITTYDHCWP